MRYFINHKTGYTAGVYGNSGEQFVLVMIDGDRYESIAYDGMYGVESRVQEPLIKADYKPVWTPSFYGKMTRKDCSYKFVLSEYDAIKAVEAFVKEGK